MYIGFLHRATTNYVARTEERDVLFSTTMLLILLCTYFHVFSLSSESEIIVSASTAALCSLYYVSLF